MKIERKENVAPSDIQAIGEVIGTILIEFDKRDLISIQDMRAVLQGYRETLPPLFDPLKSIVEPTSSDYANVLVDLIDIQLVKHEQDETAIG